MTRQLVILGTSVTLPDPASVTDLAAGFQQQSGQLADLETTLQALTRPDAWGDWTGLAADAFGQSIGQLPAELGDVRDAYEDVASALQQYAGQLEPVVNSLSSLSFQAEDAEGALAAVQNGPVPGDRERAGSGHYRLGRQAGGRQPTAVSALQGQLNRLLGELTALAAACTKQIAAAEPKTAGKSLFGELESDFVRDVADPLARAAVEAAKDDVQLLDETFFQPFTQLWADRAQWEKNPDLHTAGQLLQDYGNALGVVALVATGGRRVWSLGGRRRRRCSAFAAADGLGYVAMASHADAFALNAEALASHEDDASVDDVVNSGLSVVSDAGGAAIDDHAASVVYGTVGGVDTTALSDGIKYVLSIPEAAPAAPDVVSGLQVTADAVQGLQGLPVAPALQAAGGASVLQPAVSVPSPAVVNIQHVALSPQPGGAPGSGASGPEGNM